MDTTAVAPKKKFLAAQAEAAATSSSTPTETPVTPRPHGAGSSSAGPSTPAVQSNGSEGAWTVKDSAPAGTNPADSEEIVKFQNAQLYAAHQVIIPNCHKYFVCESIHVMRTMKSPQHSKNARFFEHIHCIYHTNHVCTNRTHANGKGKSSHLPYREI
jgi:hypothetical protein